MPFFQTYYEIKLKYKIKHIKCCSLTDVYRGNINSLKCHHSFNFTLMHHIKANKGPDRFGIFEAKANKDIR